MRKLFLGVLTLLVLLNICACANEQKYLKDEAVRESTFSYNDVILEEKNIIVIEDEEETVADIPQYQTERIVKDGYVNSYLTGRQVPVEQGLRRPIACMMSNDKEAQPQYGINRAGIVYEAPVEGGMNRFMSVIENWDDLERIGSFRSCRTYYVYFAREWDAVYAHFGQSTFAKPYLEYIDNLNGIEGRGSEAYYRTKDRKSPHNAYASAEKIKKAITACGYDTEYDSEYSGHFHFATDEYTEFLEGEGTFEAVKLVPGYVYNKPWFEYDPEDGLYHRYQYEDVHCGDEGPIAVKNVLFQYSPSGFYATTDYLNINLHEDTYGYYFTNGRGIPVSIKKDGEFGITHFYAPDGEEIILNQGQTWFCLIQSNYQERTEIFDLNGNQLHGR